ncbi:MAG: sigma-70 family RNA polymerase sigma factor [Candidatus Acidiferrales bacterium]
MVRMVDPAEDSDAAQVAETLAGNQEAFRPLVERYSQRLFRLAYRMAGNENDAEELVQETFLRAYRNLARFEARSNFGTWLYRICANCSLDHLRKRRPQNEAQELDNPDGAMSADDLTNPSPSPERLFLSGEMRYELEAALGQLTTTERTAFALRHHEGLSIEEISEILGLRISATKNAVFRGVQKLRRALAPLAGQTR